MEEKTVKDNFVPLDGYSRGDKLSDLEMANLKIMRADIRTAQALVEKAQAQNEVANITYKYYILQLYMKYKMTEIDSIGEDGEIIKNS